MEGQRDAAVSADPAVAAVPRVVGRDGELARLREALTSAPALVLIEGEAGIGKSRLVQEALAAADDVMIALCPPLRRAFTLGPIVEAARQRRESGPPAGLSALGGALRPLLPEWADDLPPAPAPLQDAGAARLRLSRALAELLDVLKVAVLVVEDVHWADEATLEFLLFLQSRRAQPLSIVLTYRPEEVQADSLLHRVCARGGATRLSLLALGVSHTAELVSSMLGGEPISMEFASFLHQRTEGLPFAIEESVRLLCDRAELAYVDGEWVRRTLAEIDVPPSVRDSVLERIARLGSDAQMLLRAAAVLAEPADEADIAAVAGLPVDTAARGLTEALGRGLLAEDGHGWLRFGHALVARAAYDAIQGPQRRRLHARALAVLQERTPRPVVQLARHARGAGDLAAWRRHTEDAADLALAAGDPVTSAEYLHELIRQADVPADLLRLARKVPALTMSGYLRRNGIIETLRSAVDLPALPDAERAELRALLGRHLIQAGEFDAGAAELVRAIPDLGHDPLLAAKSMATLGMRGGTGWPADEHRRWLDAATAAVSPSFPASERLALQVDLVTGLLEVGDPEGWEVARTLPRAPGSVAERVTVVRAAHNQGDHAMRWGRYAEARQHLVRACVLAEEYGFQRVRAYTDVSLVHLDWYTGRWRDLDARASAMSDPEDEAMIRLDAETVCCLLTDAVGGDSAETQHRLAAVLAELEARGAPALGYEPAAALARLRLREGDVAGALAATDALVALALRKEVWLWATDLLPVRVDALCAAGRHAEADDLLTGFARSVEGNAEPIAGAALNAAQGGLAEGRAEHLTAAAHFAAAADGWQALPRPYVALLVRERRGRNLVAGGERDTGLIELATVADELAALGAAGEAARVVGWLSGEGVARPRAARRGRHSYGDELSPRELEVVRLVVTGLTNPQIASALSRSPRTIAAQLMSAMRKMNVSSRTALAVAATQAGLADVSGAGPTNSNG